MVTRKDELLALSPGAYFLAQSLFFIKKRLKGGNDRLMGAEERVRYKKKTCVQIHKLESDCDRLADMQSCPFPIHSTVQVQMTTLYPSEEQVTEEEGDRVMTPSTHLHLG